MPDHPKTKVQINQKKELEQSVENYNRDLARLKQELRELNAINREF